MTKEFCVRAIPSYLTITVSQCYSLTEPVDTMKVPSLNSSTTNYCLIDAFIGRYPTICQHGAYISDEQLMKYLCK